MTMCSNDDLSSLDAAKSFQEEINEIETIVYIFLNLSNADVDFMLLH